MVGRVLVPQGGFPGEAFFEVGVQFGGEAEVEVWCVLDDDLEGGVGGDDFLDVADQDHQGFSAAGVCGGGFGDMGAASVGDGVFLLGGEGLGHVERCRQGVG